MLWRYLRWRDTVYTCLFWLLNYVVNICRNYLGWLCYRVFFEWVWCNSANFITFNITFIIIIVIVIIIICLYITKYLIILINNPYRGNLTIIITSIIYKFFFNPIKPIFNFIFNFIFFYSFQYSKQSISFINFNIIKLSLYLLIFNIMIL